MPISSDIAQMRAYISEYIFHNELLPAALAALGLLPLTPPELRMRVHAVACGTLPAPGVDPPPSADAQVLVFVDPAISTLEFKTIDDWVRGYSMILLQAVPDYRVYYQVVRAGRAKAISFAAGTAVSYHAPGRFNLPSVSAGTLGARVSDGSNEYVLSCNHVLAHNGRVPAGTAVVSPGPFEMALGGDVIAELSYCVPMDAPPWPLTGPWPVTGGINICDCALAKVMDAKFVTAFSKSVSLVLPDDPIVVDPTLVKKVGQASGPTDGFATIFDWDGYIDFTFGLYFFGQYTANFLRGRGIIGVVGQSVVGEALTPPFAVPGDSGSLVWTENPPGDDLGIGLAMARSYTFGDDNKFTGYLVLVSPLASIATALAGVMPSKPLGFFRAA